MENQVIQKQKKKKVCTVTSSVFISSSDTSLYPLRNISRSYLSYSKTQTFLYYFSKISEKSSL